MHCHMISNNQATSKAINNLRSKQAKRSEAGCVTKQCMALDQIISMSVS